jgi:hypothetical protein
LGIVARIARAIDRLSSADLRSRSPRIAHSRFIWRQLGWAFPAIVAFYSLVAAIVLSIQYREPRQLSEAYLLGSVILSGVAMGIGMVLGNGGTNCSNSEANPAMSQFIATLPMTSTDLGKSVLKVAAQCAVCGWIIWSASFLAVYCLLTAPLGHRLAPALAQFPWRSLPATLLGFWTATALGVAIIVAGRPRLTFSLLCGCFASLAGTVVVYRFLLAPEFQEPVICATAITLGTALVAATSGALLTARRRNLIDSPTVSAIVSVWVALTVLALLMSMPAPLHILILLAGLMALVIAPLAVVPQSLVWNRTR